jgi:DNA-binding transcriptional MerR regulator
MLSIGEFARLGDVSVRTLRHYGEIGLLAPAQVDPVTGYRGYSASQLGQLHRIVALKDLGLSLAQARRLLDGITVEELRGMLLLRHAQLEQQLEEHHRQLAGVAARLRYIESEGAMPADDITAKLIPETRVVAIASKSPSWETRNIVVAVNQSAVQFNELGIRNLVRAFGPLLIFFEDDGSDDLSVFVGAEVDAGVTEPPAGLPHPVELKVLPEVEAAVAVRNGAAASIFPEVYYDLLRWVHERGYQESAPNRNVWLHEVDDIAQVDDQVFEIQLPFTRAAPVQQAG